MLIPHQREVLQRATLVTVRSRVEAEKVLARLHREGWHVASVTHRGADWDIVAEQDAT